MGRFPKVTVLIPTFNRSQYIGECLDSIFNQTVPPFQVIVVNDGSLDDTGRVLELYFDRIDYLETNQLGKPGALNAGMKIVSGDYVWIFDDDDVALPDALERFVEPLENDKECGFSYSTFYYTKTNPKNNQIGEVIRETRVPDLKTRGFLIPLLEANFLGGAALFARTSCYDKVGPFDLSLIRAQDYEMAIRIARQFKGVLVRGGSTFHYRQHQGMRGSLKDRFLANNQRKKWWVYSRKFFAQLYRELPLDDYLPPGISLETNKRQALLQRIYIMSSELLYEKIISDLEEIKELNDSSPLNEIEKQIIQKLIYNTPYYDIGSLFLDYSDYFWWLKEFSAKSKVVKMIRNESLLGIAKRCKWYPKPNNLIKGFQRMYQLYFPNSYTDNF